MTIQNKEWLILKLVLALIILALIYLFSLHIISRNSQETSKKILFGAWTEGLFDGSSKTLHPEKLQEFENLIKRKVSIAHYYVGWEFLTSSQLVSQFDQLNSMGKKPMINVNPYYFDECPASKEPLYKVIAQGGCDNFLHKAGKNLRLVKKPFYLVFAWEMNNHQNEWSVTHTGSSNQDFILAWRHIHDIFKEEGVSNIIWVFCPNVPDDPIVPYGEIYPGDDYVDWIGLDGYNWGTTQSWSSWTSFSGVFTSSYNLITSIAPNKPLVLAEVNTTDQGGDKGAWYKDMFLSEIPKNFPQISAVVIFNEDKTMLEHVNWKVDVSQESLDSFTQAVNSPLYK